MGCIQIVLYIHTNWTVAIDFDSLPSLKLPFDLIGLKDLDNMGPFK